MTFVRCLLALAVFAFAAHAHAQGNSVGPGGINSVTTWYGPNGEIVDRAFQGTVGKTQWAYTTSNGQWSSAPAPNAASVTVGRNIPIGTGDGAAVGGKIPALIRSEVTAASLAKAAIPFVRGVAGGLVGLAVGAALDAALQKAMLEFDKTQNSMVYKPDPVPNKGPPQDTRIWQLSGSEPYPGGQFYTDQASACTAEGLQDFDRSVFVSAAPGAAINSCVNSLIDTASSPPVPYTLYRERLSTKIVSLQPNIGGMTCPNGVQFNDTTKCRQLVDDGKAGDLLTPQITGNNGPSIGANVTGNNGIQFQPDTGVNPGPASLPGVQVDKGSWPQTSGPATSSFGPQTTTSSSSQTTTNSSGQTLSQTTTTTTTNTTNVTNNYSNASVTNNINNKTEVRVCDPAGVCTNTTTNTTGTSATPVDKPSEQVKVCGLPNTPACKIDETGTPGATEVATAMKAPGDAVKATQTAAIDQMNAATKSTDKNAAWTFSFAFPTSCGVFVLWEGLSVDFCSFQPIVHQLMSMLWWLAGVVAVFGLWSRALTGGGTAA